MNWLLDNPVANLYGPYFLGLYAGVASGEPPGSSPYTIETPAIVTTSPGRRTGWWIR